MKQKIIEIPLYKSDIVIIKSDNFEKVSEKYDLPDITGYGAIVFKKLDEESFVTYYMVFRSDASPSLIAHEALHVVNYVFENRGIKLDPNNDEPQCYLLGWIVEQCHKFLENGK